MRCLPFFLPALFALAVVSAPTKTPRAPKDEEHVLERLMTTDAETDRQIREYWTPSRIAAIDHDPINSEPAPPVPPEKRHLGVEYAGQGQVHRTIGRLLFVDHEDNGTADSSCTATLLKSKNKATIVTAAHCLKEPLFFLNSTKWNYNHLFVPGFRDNLPTKNYTLNRAYISDTWTTGDDLNYRNDRGFAVLNADPDCGTAPGDELGEGQNIQFDNTDNPNKFRYNLGYPRYADTKDKAWNGTPAFIGMRLATCFGEPVDWWRKPSTLKGMPCFMGGGSSGGPHLIDFDMDRGLGTVVAVNSIGDVTSENGTEVAEYGQSVTDDFAKILYETAQVVKPRLK